jgi:hypothetical protein
MAIAFEAASSARSAQFLFGVPSPAQRGQCRFPLSGERFGGGCISAELRAPEVIAFEQSNIEAGRHVVNDATQLPSILRHAPHLSRFGRWRLGKQVGKMQQEFTFRACGPFAHLRSAFRMIDGHSVAESVKPMRRREVTESGMLWKVSVERLQPRVRIRRKHAIELRRFRA